MRRRSPTGSTSWPESAVRRSHSVWRRVRARSCRRNTEAEPHFRAALEALAGSRAAVDLGRAHLTYGEWLRRRKRRRDSSDQLRAAGAVFATTGAEQFVQRTNRELEAIGDRAHAATADRPAGLTSQELTVAELAAEGKTNAEIGATMFLSAHTVDYHLRKVFQKLAISSRRQLADRLEHS